MADKREYQDGDFTQFIILWLLRYCNVRMNLDGAPKLNGRWNYESMHPIALQVEVDISYADICHLFHYLYGPPDSTNNHQIKYYSIRIGCGVWVEDKKDFVEVLIQPSGNTFQF